MSEFTPFIEITEMDEAQIHEWVEKAVDEILRLRKFEELVLALGCVIDKDGYSDLRVARAAKDFIL